MNETIYAGDWIRTLIEEDSVLDVQAYRDLIPSDSPLPAVRFYVRDSSDVRGAARGTQRILTTIDWIVVVVNRGLGMAGLVPLVDRLDYVLHRDDGNPLTPEVASLIPEITVDACIRVEPWDLVEPEESGVQYRHLGGMYRMIVRPTE